MLETWMEHQVIFYAMGVAAGIGVLSKLISHFTLRRMVRAAGKMSTSNHRLMRLVKAKFEHASMVSDKVRNVEAFVKKYIYEYRVFGIGLCTWRQMEKKAVWLYGVLGVVGVAAVYEKYGMGNAAVQYGVWSAVGVLLLILIHIFSDETFYLQTAENYMVEFLENVCAHRYEKVSQQKENTGEPVVQMEEAFAEVREEEEPYEEPEEIVEEKVSQEVRIRQILEEFLA